MTTVDTNVEIGRVLREAREAAGHTVADVVHRAHLPRSVVEALEAEDFSVFSSPTYAKSFLTQYSEFLNVDAHLWLSALEPNSFVQTEGLQSIFEEHQPTSRIEPMKQRRDTPGSGSGLWSAALYVLVTAGLGYAAWKGVKHFEEQGSRPEPLVEADKYLKLINPETNAKATPAPAPAKQEVIPDSVAPPMAKTQDDLPAPIPRAKIVTE